MKKLEDKCGFVPVGQYYNDVWMYDLSCKDVEPDRSSDKACANSGWEVLHPGDLNGQCVFQNGKEVCETPSERWRHGAAMFKDETMLIYGGFSYRCVDYCDDMWAFDARDNSFLEIYELGHFKKDARSSPGKRWKFSLVPGFLNPVTKEQTMIIFGGHNQWEHDGQTGYLNDLWLYTKKLLPKREKIPIITSGYGYWHNKTGIKECAPDRSSTDWDQRSAIACDTKWPRARAGHAAVYDEARNGLWIHGGYTTYYPYMRDDMDSTVTAVTPYPTFPFFLNDLWFFDFATGLWKEYEYYGNVKPSPRAEHIIVLANKDDSSERFNSIGSNDILILYGGYYDNNHYDDTWYFNIPLSRWIQKTAFVHAKWPDTCRDDWEYIADHKECVELQLPDDLQRAPLKKEQDGRTLYRRSDMYPLNLVNQRDYVSAGSNEDYYGLHDDPVQYLLDYTVAKLAAIEALRDVTETKFPKPWYPDLPDGYLIAPNAATAPNQYAKELKMRDVLKDSRLDEYRNTRLNVTLFNEQGTIWQRCTSAKIVPTRGKVTDGLFGRPIAEVTTPVPRKQRFGWDGCTMDDVDLWVYPSSRSDHTATYVPKYGLLLFYGGVGYFPQKDNVTEVPHLDITMKDTYPTRVLDDFWAYNIYKCNNDCSNHGTCNYGWCKCDDGYYGLDCSNSTCPGDFCYYDKITNEQICNHCCYGGYEHSDLDKYIPDVKKTYCSLEDKGSSNGVCDGYGYCHCTPPFIGEDCSIKDCKYNCSFNGYCSVEFPVSRCVCAEGYFGEYCQYIECLNNCTYPYGVCDYSSGICNCSTLYNPFDNSIPWYNMNGTDCSYMMAYCAATLGMGRSAVTLLLSLAVVVKLFFDDVVNTRR